MKRTKFPDKQPKYEDFQGLICKILGRQSFLNGDGHEPFVKACKTHDPKKGKFCTWLYHNLILQKMNGNNHKIHPHPNCFIEIEEALGIDGVEDPCKIVEFKDEISYLSKDAQTIIKCVFENIGIESKRTKWPISAVCNKRDIRRDLKEHCRETLSWKWPRYWRAVHEIEKMLK